MINDCVSWNKKYEENRQDNTSSGAQHRSKTLAGWDRLESMS